MRNAHRRFAVIAITVALGALAVPGPGLAADAQDGEIRARGSCTRGSEIRLRVRADDGELRFELRIDTGRRGTRWNVIVLHERRLGFRGTVRTARSSGSLRMRRTFRDLYGRDRFVVRATGPRRESCRLDAAL